MADIELRKGDKGFAIGITWLKADGSAEDLSGLTVTLKAWVEGTPGSLLISGTCSVSGCVCTYTIQANDSTATADEWQAELEATSGTTVVKNSLPFTIAIKESG